MEESWLRYFLRRCVIPVRPFMPHIWSVVKPCLLRLMVVIGWRLDCVGPWKSIQGRKIVIFHRGDGMIPFETASLYNALGKSAFDFELGFGRRETLPAGESSDNADHGSSVPSQSSAAIEVTLDRSRHDGQFCHM